MAGGRPSTYGPDILEKTRDYIENFESYGDAMPSIAGLAVILKKSRETIHTWKKEEGKEEFSDMLGDLLARQEQVLFNRALVGDYNATIAKLALTKHGYSDSQKQEHTGKDGGPIETDNKWQVEIVHAKNEDS